MALWDLVLPTFLGTLLALLALLYLMGKLHKKLRRGPLGALFHGRRGGWGGRRHPGACGCHACAKKRWGGTKMAKKMTKNKKWHQGEVANMRP